MNTSISIVPYRAEDHDILLDIWRRGVEKTHAFLSNFDFEFYYKVVDEVLPSIELWVAVNNSDTVLGFLGIEDKKIEMLFVDPEIHRMGVGSALLDFAVKRKDCIFVDVNEQNIQARNFYRKYGFIETGRMEQDERGKPYPLLHLELEECLKKRQNKFNEI